ncbi:hypothetical protein GJ496_005716 [Pomphorhynchus laevis]|nr:hypothetical protein GJ496_005716 [Pomphorhynchus laevis]
MINKKLKRLFAVLCFCLLSVYVVCYINVTQFASNQSKIERRPHSSMIVSGHHNHGIKDDDFNSFYKSHTFPDAYTNVRYGGSWTPSHCLPVYDPIIVIVPLKNRHEHLNVFLSIMHPFLQMQNIPYSILTITQDDGEEFNRVILMNMAVLYTNKRVNCFIFADFDFIPDFYENLYTCNKMKPKCLVTSISYLDYMPKRKNAKVDNCYFGGIVALTREQFIKVNGFSTMFWGWGEENSDMYRRCVHFYGGIERVALNVGSVSHLSHPHINMSSKFRRFTKIKKASYDYTKDGLTNSDGICQLVEVTKYPLRENLVVKCKRPPESTIEKFLNISGLVS